MKPESVVNEKGIILNPEEASTIKGGQNEKEEYTYEGGELDEVEITPLSTK